MRTDRISRLLASETGIVGLLFAVGCLLFSGIASYEAPCGTWRNQIFGQPVWSELDPGAHYLAAAHQLSWAEPAIFVGHPGTTLELLLAGVQRLYFGLAGTEGFSFTQFTARNLPTVFLLSKLLMTVLHLVSFAVVLAFADSILRNRRAALFAAVGYATSLPVLYFLSRISPEPLMAILLPSAFLATWRFQEFAAAGRTRAALLCAGLAAFCAVSGAVTKLNFLGPLPFWIAAYLVLGARSAGSGATAAGRTRALSLLVFVAVGTVTLFLYSQWIGWELFISTWGAVAEGKSFVGWKAHAFPPSLAAGSIFTSSEFLFIVMGAAGWVLFLREAPETRERAVWVAVMAGWGLALFGYRVWRAGDFLPFHYFLPTSIVVAVFFGHLTDRVARRLRIGSGRWRTAAFALMWCGAIHGLAIWAVVDSRSRDAEFFAPKRSGYDLIAQLKPGEQLGLVVRNLQELDQRTRGLEAFPRVLFSSRIAPELANEFRALFRPVVRGTVDRRATRHFVPALGGEVVIVDRAGRGTR